MDTSYKSKDGMIADGEYIPFKTVNIKYEWDEYADQNELFLPKYMTLGSSGADLFANFGTNTPDDFSGIDILPWHRAGISTGLKFEIPIGYEIQIRPRSGLALKHGITVLNSPGTIDSDYRGVLMVILMNHSPHIFCVEHGQRIAQMVIVEKVGGNFIRGGLSDTERGDGGFGSTGDKKG